MALTKPAIVHISNEHTEFLRAIFDGSERFTPHAQTVCVIRESTDNSIVACAAFEIAHDECLITYTAVKTEYKNRGLNRKLIETIEEYARHFDLSELTANIKHNNISSIRSFESAGFVLDNNLESYGTSEQKLHYRKEL
jgi:N-acetylglutamate synthase-like GNAT family acetyltransferase